MRVQPNPRSSSSSTPPTTCSMARSAKSGTPLRSCWETGIADTCEGPKPASPRLDDERHMQDAVIVSAVRTPVGKAPNGTLRGTRPDELAATVIAEALRRAPGADAAEIEDVILGCAMPEGEQGLNVARIASLRAGVPVSASAVTINRFCSSGLQAIAFAAERIMCGFSSAIVAGGTESMSLVPMGGNKLAPNPALVDRYPD